MALQPLVLLTFTGLLFSITSGELQFGAPVVIENVIVEYGPWEEGSDGNLTLKFLKRAAIIISCQWTNVDITWQMRKWDSDSSDPYYETQVELLSTNHKGKSYKATLQTEYSSKHGKTLGIYEATIRAMGGYFFLHQDIYGQLYQHLTTDEDIMNNQLEVWPYPPKQVPVLDGRDVELFLFATAYGAQDFHALRRKYVTTDGNVTMQYTDLEPEMFGMEPLSDYLDHIILDSREHHVANMPPDMHYFTHILNMRAITSKDTGKYELVIRCGLQKVIVYVDIVPIGNPQYLINKPGIMLTSCNNGAAFTKGFMGLTMGTSNCIKCRVLGVEEGNIYLEKDGVPLVSSFGHTFDGGQDLNGGACLIFNFDSASKKNLGHYECRAVSAVNSNVELKRSFEVVEYIKVTVNKESANLRNSEFKLTCKAHGYPLPVVDFYYYDTHVADKAADLVHPGDDFQIQHEQIDNQTVIYTLQAPLTAEGHVETKYYCVGRNMFT